MTFKNYQPFLSGYGGAVSKSGQVLGQIPSLENTMRTRFAGEGLRQQAEHQMLKNQFEMMKYGAQPQQAQGQGGQGGTDWLGLAQTGLGLAQGLGVFGGGGGGGGMSFADGMNAGLPSFGDYSGIPSGGWGIPFG